MLPCILGKKPPIELTTSLCVRIVYAAEIFLGFHSQVLRKIVVEKLSQESTRFENI